MSTRGRVGRAGRRGGGWRSVSVEDIIRQRPDNTPHMHPVFDIPGGWLLFAGDLNGRLGAERAVHALESGLDTPHLRQLAGVAPTATGFEVPPLLARVLHEPDVEPVSEEAARRHHLREVLRELVGGRRSVVAALDEIHRTVVAPLEHPTDLQVWCAPGDDLARGPDGQVEVLADGERDRWALREAARALDGAPAV